MNSLFFLLVTSFINKLWPLECHLQKSEVVVRGDGNCFYPAIALWRDEMSDEKHEEIRRLSSTLIEKNLKVFEPLLFSSNSVKEKITGTWAETLDIFSCTSLLKRPIYTFSSSQNF